MDDKPDTDYEKRLRLIIRDETNTLLLAHLKLCPFVGNEVEKRLRQVETNTAKMIGFMAGSGIFGGAAGAVLSKLIQ